jgi:hypothetical protein
VGTRGWKIEVSRSTFYGSLCAWLWDGSLVEGSVCLTGVFAGPAMRVLPMKLRIKWAIRRLKRLATKIERRANRHRDEDKHWSEYADDLMKEGC